VQPKFSKNHVVDVTTCFHTTGLWYTQYLDSSKVFDLGWFDHSLVEGFEIMDESNLAGLRDTFVIGETTRSKQHCTVAYSLKEAYIQEETCASRPCSSFARVTVNGYHIFRVLLQPFVHLIDKREKYMERRCMMVFPIEVGYTILEFCCVISFFAYIENVIFIWVLVF